MAIKRVQDRSHPRAQLTSNRSPSTVYGRLRLLARHSTSKRKELHVTDKITAANKALLRRFYNEVYVDWNMDLADEVLSPRFTSHD